MGESNAQPGGAEAPRRGIPGLPRNVVALGVVSLLTDVSSEMIVPVLPLFVVGVLGASAAAPSASTAASTRWARSSGRWPPTPC